MNKQYKVVLRDHSEKIIPADNVHVTAQGNVKLLNGSGSRAELVAFYNASDVISVEVAHEALA